MLVDWNAVDTGVFDAHSGTNHRVGQRGGFIGRHVPQQDRHQQRRCLVVGQTAVGHTGDKKVDVGAIERTTIALLSYEIDRAHQGLEEDLAKAGLYYRLE